MKVEIAENYYRNLEEWNKSIKFYADEIRVFEKRLKEVLQANTKIAVTTKAEHFQNQFILQKEQFDILIHDINEEKTKISLDMSEKLPAINTQSGKKNLIESGVKTAEKIFSETKASFNRFLSEVL